MLRRCFFLLILFFLFTFATVYAQDHISVNSSGGEATGSTGTVNFSVGQLIYTSYANGNATVEEGIQQAYEIYTISVPDLAIKKIDVKIYPNPTTDYLIIDLKQTPQSAVSYQLVDLKGQLLQTARINQNQTKILMEPYAKATYLLYIWDDNKKANAYKIIKH